VRLIVVLDAHGQHVHENQHENDDFKSKKSESAFLLIGPLKRTRVEKSAHLLELERS
jgi:hypothetical protein